MDYGRSGAIVVNPVAGHSPYIDEKTGEWGNVEADILSYLSDINKLEEFADLATNAEELALRHDAFKGNATKYLEAMVKLAEGQVTWTEIRKQFGSKVANAIAKIRKLDAEFGSEIELIDAKDRATMLKINEKRQNGLAEVAAELVGDLEAESWRHQNKMDAITNRDLVAAERQTIQKGLAEKRRELLSRATNGTIEGVRDKIPVAITAGGAPRNAVSASGNARGFSGWFNKLFNNN